MGQLGRSLREQGYNREAGHVAMGGHAASMHSGHVGNLSSTWRASLCPTWSPFLGRLCSELGYGPLRKVVPLLMLYKLD